MINFVLGLIFGAIGYHFYITGEFNDALEEARSAIHSATKPESVIDQLKGKF